MKITKLRSDLYVIRERQNDYQQLNEKETLRSYLDTFTWEKIEDEESGFYNNEGGYGEIIFDVAERTIKMEHNNYIQETVYSEHEL